PVAMKNLPALRVLARVLCASTILASTAFVSAAHANVPIPRLQWSEHLATSRSATPVPVARSGIRLRLDADASDSLI
ncbi:hypothetical protein, partial [Mycobacterium tuberculosis]